MLFETRPPLPFSIGAPAYQSKDHPSNLFQPLRMQSLDDELTLLKLAGGEKDRVVFRWDLNAHVLEWSANLAEVFPALKNRAAATESEWLSLIHPDDRASFMELKNALLAGPRSFSLEYRLTPGNGETCRVRQLGEMRADGSRKVIGLLERPSASVSRTQLAVPMNEGIHLRGHYSYPADFTAALDDVIAAHAREQRSGALVVLFLNNLPMIINSCGHHQAEELIQQLLQRVREALPDARLIGRISRDQFGIVLEDATAQVAHQVAGRLQKVVEKYGTLATDAIAHMTCLTASVDFPNAARNGTDALDKAYVTLSNPGSARYRTYEDAKNEIVLSRQNMGLANYLRRTVEEDRLCLAYQPIIESRTGGVAHYEALLRVIGEDGKISSAGPLIPVAESMGMIDMIDSLVLEMVAKEVSAHPALNVAFNVSNLTTDNPQWLDHFHEVMKRYPEAAPRIIVEITETAAQRDLRRMAFFVASVQSAGCQVALDDFGSGYTSFRQLKALSVDMVKIDGAFVRDLVDNVENRFFIKTLLGFTSGMGLKAVAEFVESGEIAKILLELGVEYMQGYYFGKPDVEKPWHTK